MKKEIDIKNFLVYLTMGLLGIMIFIPPILRIVLKDGPQTDEQQQLQPTDAKALICKKQVVEDNTTYNITITSSYQNNELNRVTFQYAFSNASNMTMIEPQTEEDANSNTPSTMPNTETTEEVTPPIEGNTETTEDPSTPTPTTPTTPDSNPSTTVLPSVAEEIASLRQNSLVTETATDNSTRFVLEKENINENLDDPFVQQYNNKMDAQKEYLTSLQYNCEEMEA